MKKLLNDPYKYVDEMLVGMCAAHPEIYRQTGPVRPIDQRVDYVRNLVGGRSRRSEIV